MATARAAPRHAPLALALLLLTAGSCWAQTGFSSASSDEAAGVLGPAGQGPADPFVFDLSLDETPAPVAGAYGAAADDGVAARMGLESGTLDAVADDAAPSAEEQFESLMARRGARLGRWAAPDAGAEAGAGADPAAEQYRLESAQAEAYADGQQQGGAGAAEEQRVLDAAATEEEAEAIRLANLAELDRDAATLSARDRFKAHTFTVVVDPTHPAPAAAGKPAPAPAPAPAAAAVAGGATGAAGAASLEQSETQTLEQSPRGEASGTFADLQAEAAAAAAADHAELAPVDLLADDSVAVPVTAAPGAAGGARRAGAALSVGAISGIAVGALVAVLAGTGVLLMLRARAITAQTASGYKPTAAAEDVELAARAASAASAAASTAASAASGAAPDIRRFTLSD
ncbi:hypothetical protein HT031_003291 [Scenedesmus sp. PABB004]|nr:hypothetical protein HT031_003291 [Scenedesmus sp. PABB004]